MKTGVEWVIALAAVASVTGCSERAQTAADAQISAAPAVMIAAGTTQTAASDPAGMKIYLDPATGQPRDPSAEELAAASRARVSEQSTTATEATSRVRVLENGQVEVDVGKRGVHELRVCRQPDGTLSEENCPTNAGKPR